MSRPALPQPPLRSWLIAALTGSPAWPPDQVADRAADTEQAIAALLAAAGAEGVAVVICHRLRTLPCWDALPKPFQQGLYRATRQAVGWDIASRKSLTDAFDAIAAEGIDFLLLKGAGLAHLLYPAPHHRTRGDTDLLVADRETADRVHHLLEQQGYEKAVGIQGRFVSHQFACSKPGPTGGTLDIHWRLSNSNLFGRKLQMAPLWAERRAVPALGPHAATLSPRHALIHALFHRAWHLGEGDPDRLIWLYDIHLLCRSYDAQAWDAFTAEVSRLGLQPICRDGLQDVSAILGTPLPPEVTLRLSAGTPSGPLGQMALKRPGMRRKLADLMSLPTWPERLGFVREHLFPDTAYMRQRFGANTPWQLAFAYLHRAAKALRKMR